MHLTPAIVLSLNWLPFGAVTHWPTPPESVTDAASVTWLGLDYTRVEMVGMQDFTEPAEIFPGYLNKWNSLVLEEQLDDLSAALRRPVTTSVNRAGDRNKKVAPNIIREFADDTRTQQSRLSTRDLEKVARGYAGVGEGVGLVFVVDELLKERELGCMHLAFVDIKGGGLLWSQWTCEDVGGFGFRNYWFTPVKEAISHLKAEARRW